jgi:glycosyltransferase involved in cell wall biosynthesis
VNNKIICLVIPSLHVGGMERVMSELAQYFCKRKEYEVHLLMYGFTREISYPIPNNLIIHKPNFEFDNNRRFWNTLKTFWFLRKEMKCIQPDATLSFGELWNNFVLITLLGMKFPVIVSDRCQPDKSLGLLHDALRKLLYPKAAGVICQTETAKLIYEKMFRQSNFQVIGNPIRAIKDNPHIQKENIILTVGRLISSKHHDELIEIFAEIDPEGWRLIIVGDDALKQQNKTKFDALIVKLGMQKKVFLEGKRLDVDDYYNRSKIFAFTSSSEGFPNVLGEAMSAGLPVVAYDCVTGPSDLIEHEKSGYLVKSRNRKEFKISLEALIADEFKREEMGQRGRLIIGDYSIEEIGRKFEKIITDENTSD